MAAAMASAATDRTMGTPTLATPLAVVPVAGGGVAVALPAGAVALAQLRIAETGFIWIAASTISVALHMGAAPLAPGATHAAPFPVGERAVAYQLQRQFWIAGFFPAVKKTAGSTLPLAKAAWSCCWSTGTRDWQVFSLGMVPSTHCEQGVIWKVWALTRADVAKRATVASLKSMVGRMCVGMCRMLGMMKKNKKRRNSSL